MFLGIPYTQPPVGDLRLRVPQSINASFGTIDATAYGPHCWDSFTTGFDDNSGFPNSEDCLTLNVIRPSGISSSSTPIPVNFWIHGGGLIMGGSSDFRYNATGLVQASVDNGNPIIFVSIKYRLGSLGWLGGKAMADDGSLNLGLRDQRLALHWVQENIAQFGGDPTRVTVQGQSVSLPRSAGGSSISAHIVAYGGRDDKLFNQAIIESGTEIDPWGIPTSPEYQATYDSLIANTSCSSTANSSESVQLACLRALPIDEFRMVSNGTTDLLLDNDMLTLKSALASFEQGEWVRVAFLVGSNTDEGRTLAPLGANTTAQASAFLASTIPPVENRNAILELYPDVPEIGCPFNTGAFQLAPLQNGMFGTPGTQNKRVQAIVGDVVMDAPPRYLAQKVSSEVPFFKYRWNHIPYSVSFSVEDYIGHFTEVSYVFNLQNNDTEFWINNHFTATYLGPTAPIEDRFLGVYLSRSWAAFAATGDPNNANVTTKLQWPKYSDSPSDMVWRSQGSTIELDNYREEGISYIINNFFLSFYQ
ncbi:alpha/beta-hydrolase [Gymnopus androsaceus JB14]|uniref:Alpha/beta-hydrolase n=1 Tax=Gymnopus androsaceus JB14 TaxID=1447944 RepID=A0A6A4HDE5_9AGAR|nr:alpha/beta-hydrolase [Gymnopus androsaceus JB14]